MSASPSPTDDGVCALVACGLHRRFWSERRPPMDAARSHPVFRTFSGTGSRRAQPSRPRTMVAGLAVIPALLIPALLLVAPALSFLWSGAPGAAVLIAASAIDPGSGRIAF